MPDLGQNIKDLLAAAPELIHTPQATTGLAVGLQSVPADTRQIAAASVAAQWAQGIQEHLADLEEVNSGVQPQPTA